MAICIASIIARACSSGPRRYLAGILGAYLDQPPITPGVRPHLQPARPGAGDIHPAPPDARPCESPCQYTGTDHRLTDSKGISFSYSFSIRRGMLFSFVIGLVASTLGIGGGPFLGDHAGLPPAFSPPCGHGHFTIYADDHEPGWSFAHFIAGGDFDQGFMHVLFLSMGVLVGAQIGARLSERLPGTIISRIMAGGLILIGIRFAIHAFERLTVGSEGPASVLLTNRPIKEVNDVSESVASRCLTKLANSNPICSCGA